MTEKTAKKARDIIDKLEQHRMFLKEYDKCSSKTIVVRRDSLSNIGSSIDFNYDDDFENAIRELIVGKIKDMEKKLEEL